MKETRWNSPGKYTYDAGLTYDETLALSNKQKKGKIFNFFTENMQPEFSRKRSHRISWHFQVG